MSRFTRRNFVKSSLFAGGAFVIAGTKSSGNVLGSNDRIRVAVAGLHGRGQSHYGAYSKMKDVEVTYVVDPDTTQFEAAINSVKANAGNTPRSVQDIRTVLDDPEVDAVSIATPNHWHSLMTIWSCQAGKDVYVEKPSSHNVHEGRMAVEFARYHNRIVQHGTQNRSDERFARTMAHIHSGKYGKLKVARGYCYKGRGSIGFKEPEPAPTTLDFDIWLGPAPMQPFHRNLVHYNWHWFWDTGNGDIGNQGVHEMDVARWSIKGATLPKSVLSLGGRFGYKDQGQTANTQLALFDYGETQLIFEVRGLKAERKVGNDFVLEEGTIANGRFYPRGQAGDGEPLPDIEISLGPGGDNFGNFIAAVRSRKPQDLNADVLEAHYSSALCHLANISMRLGKEVSFRSTPEPFQGNDAATAAFEGMKEHLAGENELMLDGVNYQLGRMLTVDSSSETFVEDEQANAMLTRSYREPFVVPEKVA